MAWTAKPTASLTYILVDETGSRATLTFDVPYATLAAVAIAAADALVVLIQGVTKCAVLSYSLTYSKVDSEPATPDSLSRVERKGVFIFLTAAGKKVRYSVPGIIDAAVTFTGRIDDDQAAVALFTTAITEVGAVFADSNGVDIVSLDQAYESYRRSTRKMLPGERRPD